MTHNFMRMLAMYEVVSDLSFVRGPGCRCLLCLHCGGCMWLLHVHLDSLFSLSTQRTTGSAHTAPGEKKTTTTKNTMRMKNTMKMKMKTRKRMRFAAGDTWDERDPSQANPCDAEANPRAPSTITTTMTAAAAVVPAVPAVVVKVLTVVTTWITTRTPTSLTRARTRTIACTSASLARTTSGTLCRTSSHPC